MGRLVSLMKEEIIEKRVEENILLVRLVINKKFYMTIQKYKGISEDMFQEGCIALFEASKLYDENKGFKFSTYACTFIYRHLLKFVSRQIKNYYLDADSIDKVIYKNPGDKDITLIETLETEEYGYADVESQYKEKLELAIAKTRTNNNYIDEIVKFRMEGKTQKEVGKLIGRYQAEVSRTLKELRFNYEYQEIVFERAM